MTLLRFAGPLFSFGLAASLGGCGHTVNVSTGGSTSSGATTGASSPTSATSTTSTGSATVHGCQSSADCGGGMCVPLTPGGFQVCLTIPPEATMCMGMNGTDQCCTSADCASKGGGKCYSSTNLQFCGGAQLQENECVTDQCTSDSDCTMNGTNGVCAPAGAFDNPARACVTAYCKTDADCKASPGGACLLVGNNDCCKYPSPAGLGCVYPGGCTKTSDCMMGELCTIDSTGKSVCKMGFMGCPG